MPIPVVPFLVSLVILEGMVFIVFMNSGLWPVGILATLNFLYSTNREIWHNGRPLVIGRRR